MHVQAFRKGTTVHVSCTVRLAIGGSLERNPILLFPSSYDTTKPNVRTSDSIDRETVGAQKIILYTIFGVIFRKLYIYRKIIVENII